VARRRGHVAALVAVAVVVAAALVSAATRDATVFELVGPARIVVSAPAGADVALVAPRLRNTSDRELVVTGATWGPVRGEASDPSPPGVVVADLVAAAPVVGLPAWEPTWPPSWLDGRFGAPKDQPVLAGGELQLVFRLARTAPGPVTVGPLHVEYLLDAQQHRASVPVHVELRP